MSTVRYNFKDIDAWIDAHKDKFAAESLLRFRAAIELAIVKYANRSFYPTDIPLIKYALMCAAVVADMHLYEDAVIASILFALPETSANWRNELLQFDQQVTILVTGIDKIRITEQTESTNINTKDSDHKEQMEAMRDMFLAIAVDIRILLIMLVIRSKLMQNLKSCTNFATQQTAAYITLEVFAPLANRLGMWQIKWELEDVAFKFLHLDEYRRLVELLDENRDDRISYMNSLHTIFTGLLDKNNVVNYKIMGRVKHIYSIWCKMQRKKYNFEDLHDIRAIRILVENIEDCYTVLGIVHAAYNPIPAAFDDYIANPKPNHYRSLHTCVIGPENKVIEIQIRTYEMHEYAEHGIAAHWRYKEGGNQEHDSSINQEEFVEKMSEIRQMLHLHDDSASEDDTVSTFKNEIFNDQIYVMTPKGKVIVLPNGATVVDFAYYLHTELGHGCRGAKIDGQMATLSTVLKNGQIVEIFSVKDGKPSINWLYDGLVKTNKAIKHIRSYIRSQNLETFIVTGMEMLERELNKLSFQQRPNIQAVVSGLGYDNDKTLCVDLGRGELALSTLRLALQKIIHREESKSTDGITPDTIVLATDKGKHNNTPKGIMVGGVAGISYYIAKCCKPLPGDEVIGFISKGHGVAIHRNTCKELKRQAKVDVGRIIKVDWGKDMERAVFNTDIIVFANQRSDLLREITNLFAVEKLSIIGLKTVYKTGTVKFIFNVQMVGMQLDITVLINKLFTLDGVLHVARR